MSQPTIIVIKNDSIVVLTKCIEHWFELFEIVCQSQLFETLLKLIYLFLIILRVRDNVEYIFILHPTCTGWQRYESFSPSVKAKRKRDGQIFNWWERQVNGIIEPYRSWVISSSQQTANTSSLLSQYTSEIKRTHLRYSKRFHVAIAHLNNYWFC